MRTEKKSEIIKILEKSEEVEGLEAGTIAERIGLSYDTTSKYLKRMTEEGILVRGAITKKRETKHSWESDYHPWDYYYKLNKEYQEK